MTLPLHTTELFMYAEEGNIEAIKAKIADGVDINTPGDIQNTILHIAAANGHKELVNFLITANADVNAIDNFGMTPLHCATGYPKIMQILINAGANINAQEDAERTSLHMAIIEEDIESISFLIKAGANINIYDQEGDTPLHYAAGYGLKEICSKLLAAGANTSMQNIHNQTPTDIALLKDHQDILILLKSPQTKGIIASHTIATYVSGIIAVIFNTFDRGIDYHRENRETYVFTNREGESYTVFIPELKDHLISKKIYIISELQEKNQIIFYYTPEELLRLK